MKKWALIISSFLLIVILFGCLAFHPRGIFLRKFYFALPMSARIESCSYDLYWDRLEMKASFHDDDYPVILERIEESEKVRLQHDWALSEEESDKSIYISYNKEMENFVTGYKGGRLGLHGMKTRLISILITRDKTNPDQYFLYVYY